MSDPVDHRRGSVSERGCVGASVPPLTSGLILQPLDGLQQRLLLVQLALQEGVPLDGLVQTALKVLQRDDGGPGQEEQEEQQEEEEEEVRFLEAAGTKSIAQQQNIRCYS